jgi:hypothetical protein
MLSRNTYLIIFLLIIVAITVIFYFPEKNKDLIILIKEVVSVITPIIGFFLFWRGSDQYEKEQKWKRAEFAAREMKEFRSDPIVQKVMMMLDWDNRDIQLSEDVKLKLEDDIDSELCKSLRATRKGDFLDHQTLIRDYFDVFFDYLGRFEASIESGLLDKSDFEPYLKYWLNIIGNKNSNKRSPEFYRNIWEYIEYFDYKNVQSFMARYKYDIKPKSFTHED